LTVIFSHFTNLSDFEVTRMNLQAAVIKLYRRIKELNFVVCHIQCNTTICHRIE